MDFPRKVTTSNQPPERARPAIGSRNTMCVDDVHDTLVLVEGE